MSGTENPGNMETSDQIIILVIIITTEVIKIRIPTSTTTKSEPDKK